MPTIFPQATPIAGGWQVGWFGIAAGDSCVPWPYKGTEGGAINRAHPNDVAILTDRTVQVYGGTVGTMHVEGTLHVATAIATWATLHEVDGTTALTFTAAGIRQILEPTYFTRPATGGASSGTNVLIKFTSQAAPRA